MIYINTCQEKFRSHLQLIPPDHFSIDGRCDPAIFSNTTLTQCPLYRGRISLTQSLAPGTHRIDLSPRGEGDQIPSGVYFVHINIVGEESIIRRVVLL